MNIKVNLIPDNISLLASVTELCAQLGITLCNSGITVRASNGKLLSVKKCDDGSISVTYSRKCELFRALSYLPAVLCEGDLAIIEKNRYSMLCYMADMSRNAVYNIDTAKQMIRYLAMMGYDSMMLYTEDTYELPGYSYFGYMRGRFTEDELRSLDDYADSFGIELIPCVQTLAHLGAAVQWPDFRGMVDTSDILLVGEEKTYKFIEAIIAQCRKCFRSSRINIGMDEAHMLACGEYLKRNGYRKPSDVMLEHLGRVVDICHRSGYNPMMWSDMFFSMAFRGNYYVSEGEIPEDVIKKVPSGLTLIYWDYYSLDPKLFSHMLDCHNSFANPTAFAGGAWKWSGFGSHNRFSLAASKLQLDLCEERNITNIIVTAWGDNGAEASQFSVLATMLFYAERCYYGQTDDKQLDRRSHLCFDTSFEDMLSFDLPDTLPGTAVGEVTKPVNPSKYLLYNDLLEGYFDKHLDRTTAPAAFAENSRKLLSLAGNRNFGYAFETLGHLCAILALKSDMGLRLRDAYKAGDKDTLRTIAEKEIPAILKELDKFIISFRNQWYRENKSFGFSVQEIRLGGLRERIVSVKLRLDNYLRGDILTIPELEQPVLSFNGCEPEEGKSPYISFNRWNRLVTACPI